ATTKALGRELWALPLTQAHLSIGDTHAAEGDGSTSTARFKVTLDRPAKQTVSVDYATSDGTARAGQDYDAASGTLTFAPGETATTMDVRVRGAVATENNETFFVTLRNAAGATLLKGEASAVIDDDDQFADVGVVLSSSIDAFGSIQDPVTVSNKGRRRQ